MNVPDDVFAADVDGRGAGVPVSRISTVRTFSAIVLLCHTMANFVSPNATICDRIEGKQADNATYAASSRRILSLIQTNVSRDR